MPVRADDPRILHCEEFESRLIPAEWVLKDGKLDVFKSTRAYVSFSLTEKGVLAQVKQYVGLIPVNERLKLRVIPRVPLTDLTKIVTWLSMDTVPLVALRSYGDTLSAEQWMVELQIDAYLQSLNGLREKGLQRHYLMREEVGTFPKGRMNLSQTARIRATGRAPQVSYAWFERTVQTVANEILRAALQYCLELCVSSDRGQVTKTMRGRVGRLNAMLHTFREVSMSAYPPAYVSQAREIERNLPSHLGHYRQPLALARRILAGNGFTLDADGDIELGTSLLINMGDLFETLIRQAITESFSRRQNPVLVYDGNKDDVAKRRLYEGVDQRALKLAPDRPAAVDTNSAQRQMTPDVVITDPTGSCILVADVKNKVAGPMPDRADVEQVLAYAVRYGVTEALIIYPRAGALARGMQAVGLIGGVRIFQYHYDLEATDLLEEADRLGGALEKLLRD